MLCLTGNMYGQRNRTGQPDWSLATIQAVADRPEGPFTEVYGHEVLGSVNWRASVQKRFCGTVPDICSIRRERIPAEAISEP